MAGIDLNTTESQTVDDSDAGTTTKSNIISSEHNTNIDIDRTSSTTRSAGFKGGRRRNSAGTSTVSMIDPELLAAAVEQIICDDSDERKAQLCCGSCCDLVRACLIVDSVYFLFMILIVIADYTDFPLFENVSNIASDGVRNEFGDGDDDDDNYRYVGDDDDDDYSSINININNDYDSGHGVDCFFCTSAFQAICGILFSLIGFIGVIRFWKYLVLLQGIWMCVDAILYCVYQNWPSGLCLAFYAYPHIALFLAQRSGKITRDNYTKTEQYCCFFDRISEDDDDSRR